jgi:hypothetical protein
MKKLILSLFCCAAFSAPAQVVVHTKPVHLGMDWTSYGAISGTSFPQGFWVNYMAMHFACMYPQFTNSFYNESRGGASWDFQYQNDMPSFFLAWRCWQDQEILTAYEDLEIEPASDNGGYGTTNVAFSAGTNLNICPPIFWNGSANVNLSSDLDYHPYRWFLGGIPGSFPSATNRDIACIQLMQFTHGITVPGLLVPMMSRGWQADLASPTPVLGFYTGGHPYAAGHMFMFAATVREMNEDTNVGFIRINWNDASFTASNATVSGNSISGSRFSSNLKWSKMAPGFDRPNGTLTNNCWPAFQLDPSLLTLYNWRVYGTNFPDGAIITAKLDGELWFQMTGYDFNHSGANIYTNFNTGLGRKRDLVMHDVRDQQGMDYVSLQATHIAGSVGANGWQDAINVGSVVFASVQAGNFGIQIYNDSSTHGGTLTPHQAMTNYFQFDQRIHDDAQQDTYSLTIDVAVGTKHSRLRIGH